MTFHLRLTDDNGVVFDASGVPDSSGVTNVITAREGWEGGVALQSTSWLNRWSDGTFPSSVRRSGRVMTFSGTAFGATAQQVRDLKRTISSLFSGVQSPAQHLGLLECDDGSGVWLHCQALLDDSIKFTSAEDAGWVQYQLPLYAPDPHLYGAEQDISTGPYTHGTGLSFPIAFPLDWGTAGNPGTAHFVNTGLSSTTVTCTVSGGLSAGFQLKRQESGGSVTVNWPLLSGDSVTVDTANAAVFINGQSSLGNYTVADEWWTVSPGDSCTIQFIPLGAVTGNPMLTLSACPAWM